MCPCCGSVVDAADIERCDLCSKEVCPNCGLSHECDRG